MEKDKAPCRKMICHEMSPGKQISLYSLSWDELHARNLSIMFVFQSFRWIETWHLCDENTDKDLELAEIWEGCLAAVGSNVVAFRELVSNHVIQARSILAQRKQWLDIHARSHDWYHQHHTTACGFRVMKKWIMKKTSPVGKVEWCLNQSHSIISLVVHTIEDHIPHPVANKKCNEYLKSI